MPIIEAHCGLVMTASCHGALEIVDSIVIMSTSSSSAV